MTVPGFSKSADNANESLHWVMRKVSRSNAQANRPVVVKNFSVTKGGPGVLYGAIGLHSEGDQGKNCTGK